MRKPILLTAFAVGVVACIAPSASAAVKPHGLFTDNIVLQQGMRVPVWGTADDGEKITVQMQDQQVSTTASGGKWIVHLSNLKPGGPFDLTITGTNTIQLKNVLVGEVWICSGQSNMEWPMKASRHPEKDIAEANHPNIRLFFTPKTPMSTPHTGQWKGPTTWLECNPDNVEKFSAVGYFFGRDLHKARNVPIGLIQCAWGGTEAERWTSAKVLEGLVASKTVTPRQKQPSDLYNGMLSPLIPFAIRGAIWYQGESNADRAYQYETLFSGMIKNWRDDWHQGDFPFLFVQLAPWDQPKTPTWPELREAQLRTAQTVKNTAMAVITDFGDPKDIHPKDKDPVGARLALCARAIAYHEKIVYSGPEYTAMKVEGDKAVLSFKHLGGGLTVKGDKLSGFTIAGADKKFVPAEATIAGDTVVVHSPMVSRPDAVRFGWANYPIVNLYNRAGLPASPFRTDDYPMITRK